MRGNLPRSGADGCATAMSRLTIHSMTRAEVLVVPLLAFLLGCSEVQVDTGKACVIPVGAVCDCSSGEFTVCNFEPPVFEDEEGDGTWGCTRGELPADSAQRIEIGLGRGRGDSWDLECSAEKTGDRELLIQASFRWRPDKDADLEPELFVACHTPPLAAGVWTIRYGEGQRNVEIGSSDAPLTCIYSGNEH